MALFGLFGKKESGNETVPQNDVEKWILGTYAMWAAYADGDWHYIAGSTEKNKQEGASMRVILRRDWEISNKTALFDMVDYLTALYCEGTDCEAEDIASGAWDLSAAISNVRKWCRNRQRSAGLCRNITIHGQSYTTVISRDTGTGGQSREAMRRRILRPGKLYAVI